MSEKLGEALLDLDTNDKPLNAGIDRAERKARGLGAVFDDVSARAMRLGRNLSIGAAAGVTAFGVAVLHATRRVAEMSAEAKMAGVHVEDFQRLRYAAEQNLVGVDALTDGLKELNLRADEFVVTGQGSAAEAFKRLGFSAVDLKAKLADPAALFTEIIGRLAQLDTAAQIRISDEIFGGSGGEQFIRLLDGGAEGIRRLGDEADRLGLVIGSDNVDAMVEFDATTKRLGSAFDMLIAKVGIGVMPQLNLLADKLSDPAIVSGAQGMAQGVVGVFNWIVDGVGLAIDKIGQFANLIEWMATHDWQTGALNPEALAAREDALRNAAKARITGLIGRGDMSEPGDAFMASIFGTNTQAAGPTTPSGLSGLGFTSGLGGAQEVDKVKELIDSLKDELAVLRETDPVQQRLLGMRENLAKATDTQRAEAENLIRTIYEETRAWESAQQAGQFFGDQLLSSIEALRTGSKSLNEVLLDVTNTLIQMVAQSMLMGQGPLAGIFGSANPNGGIGGILGSLFAGFFATGGLIPSGSFGIVGERGPEIAFGTSAGTEVLPNSTLTDIMAGAGASGPLQVVIQGSGLSQAELMQAISDALEQFDRFKLPQRVAEINSDPLARG